MGAERLSSSLSLASAGRPYCMQAQSGQLLGPETCTSNRVKGRPQKQKFLGHHGLGGVTASLRAGAGGSGGSGTARPRSPRPFPSPRRRRDHEKKSAAAAREQQAAELQQPRPPFTNRGLALQRAAAAAIRLLSAACAPRDADRALGLGCPPRFSLLPRVEQPRRLPSSS